MKEDEQQVEAPLCERVGGQQLRALHQHRDSRGRSSPRCSSCSSVFAVRLRAAVVGGVQAVGVVLRGQQGDGRSGLLRGVRSTPCLRGPRRGCEQAVQHSEGKVPEEVYALTEVNCQWRLI